MDETTKNFWNKTAEELTVKDNLILAAVIPAAMVGGFVVIGAGFAAANKISNKFQSIRVNRRTAKTEEN